MEKKHLLWLDDIRNPYDTEVDWMKYSPIGRDCEIHWVKDYIGFCGWIKENGLPDGICFDHDLGEDVAIAKVERGVNKKQARREKKEAKSGFDAAKWLVDYCIDEKVSLPLWAIQSANPVGKENISGLLTNFMKHQ